MHIELMVGYTIIIVLIFVWVYIAYYRHKIFEVELELSDLFKKRNYQVLSIYGVSKNYLNKHEDIFKEFLGLKKRDFSENIHQLGLEGKLPVYTKIHDEINFIFKVCEKHPDLSKNPIYNYIKDSLLEKSSIIGKKYNIYKQKREKFHTIHTITKFLLVGFLVRD